MPNKYIQSHKHEGKGIEKSAGAAAEVSPTTRKSKGHGKQG